MREKKVLVYGSLNLDHVYQVDHIVVPGETISSKGMQTFCGGKGMNQAIAFAKAGAMVYMAGKIGEDGMLLKQSCEYYGVRTEFLTECKEPSGSTAIQVDAKGENCIVLFGGTNQMQTKKEVDAVLSHFEEGDYIVLQNEINEVNYIISQAKKKGMEIVLNPSPYDEKMKTYDIRGLSWIILNEIEAFQMTGEKDPHQAIEEIHKLCPMAGIVLTLGKEGSICMKDGNTVTQKCYLADAVDTTAAGDTFTGYFFSWVIKGRQIQEALDVASRASAIAVSRKGAVESIPFSKELENSL